MNIGLAFQRNRKCPTNRMVLRWRKNHFCIHWMSQSIQKMSQKKKKNKRTKRATKTNTFLSEYFIWKRNIHNNFCRFIFTKIASTAVYMLTKPQAVANSFACVSITFFQFDLRFRHTKSKYELLFFRLFLYLQSSCNVFGFLARFAFIYWIVY